MDVALKFLKEGYSKIYEIIQNDIIVGQIILRECDNRVIIESISINLLFKKQGIGRQVINNLKEKYSIISGNSSPTAIGFWKKLGAEFDYEIDENNHDIVSYLLDIGEYPSFIIKS